MKYVVIIEDKYTEIDHYVDSIDFLFKDKLTTKWFQNPESAISFINENEKSILLIILDIMFRRTGKIEGGYNKGIEFYNNVLKKKYKHIKIILLTQRNINGLRDFQKVVISNNDIMFEKINYNIIKFNDLLKELLKNE
jgi:hypothetical protein